MNNIGNKIIKPFGIIAALDENFGIGKSGNLPWHLPGDLKHFKNITTKTGHRDKKNAVIMGRKTWDSLPNSFKPLPGRINCVITRKVTSPFPDNVIVCENCPDIFRRLDQLFPDSLDKIFVIGGAQIFAETIHYPDCEKLYLTHIRKDFQCDTFFPKVLSDYHKTSETPLQKEHDLSFTFAEYARSKKAVSNTLL